MVYRRTYVSLESLLHIFLCVTNHFMALADLLLYGVPFWSCFRIGEMRFTETLPQQGSSLECLLTPLSSVLTVSDWVLVVKWTLG